ncbi:unnamed protein product [Cyclocybe aegerita]|uniref:Uncharacterized protein n=1 Tax=Cyclocybe aegerita TaxID=1973307 RepID=A0A8S0WKB4_CYCAE|nr:unnamed protein product [Cyclocybe aegerita]
MVLLSLRFILEADLCLGLGKGGGVPGRGVARVRVAVPITFPSSAWHDAWGKSLIWVFGDGRLEEGEVFVDLIWKVLRGLSVFAKTPCSPRAKRRTQELKLIDNDNVLAEWSFGWWTTACALTKSSQAGLSLLAVHAKGQDSRQL